MAITNFNPITHDPIYSVRTSTVGVFFRELRRKLPSDVYTGRPRELHSQNPATTSEPSCRHIHIPRFLAPVSTTWAETEAHSTNTIFIHSIVVVYLLCGCISRLDRTCGSHILCVICDGLESSCRYAAVE